MNPRIKEIMETSNAERIPQWILSNIRERLGYESDDTSHDDEINDMTPREIFEEWLEWQGICGYSDRILKAIHVIFEVDLRY